MSSSRIRVMIADDHGLIRQGIRRLLEFEEDVAVVAEASNGQEALSHVSVLKPDVLLLDVHMPEMSGIQVLKRLVEAQSTTRVIMLTMADDPETLFECIQTGAQGYLLKDSDTVDLISAIREVMKGESFIDKRLVKLLLQNVTDKAESNSAFGELTDRELDVLSCISQGLTNREVGETLFLSEKTVKNYATSLFRKIEVKDRVQATLYAINNDLAGYLSKR